MIASRYGVSFFGDKNVLFYILVMVVHLHTIDLST